VRNRKNQAGREENLTNREKDSVRLLPKCNEADSEAEAGSDSGSEDDMVYATNILELHHQQKRRHVSKYRSTKQLTSTVCIFQRLYSRTRLLCASIERLCSMQPWILEHLVFSRAYNLGTY
jgi:hypothetical protein